MGNARKGGNAMIAWIIGGYLVASVLASVVIYAACVAAGRADERR
jgi:hypothetical protein